MLRNARQAHTPRRLDDQAAVGVVGVVLMVGIAVALVTASFLLYQRLYERGEDPPVSAGQAAFTPSGYVVTLAGPEDVPVHGGHQIRLLIDGNVTELPLSAAASQLPDPTIWRVGQSICMVGPAPCLVASGETVGVEVRANNVVVFNLPPLRYVVAGPSFLIQPNGGISVACDQPTAVKVLGTEITYGAGGPTIPVTMGLSTNGLPPFAPLFGGAVHGGEVLNLNTIPAGSVLGVQASADYSDFHSRYDSFSGDAHVKVLRDGDPAPDIQAFANQAGVSTYLQPYVNVNTHTMTLGPNEAILLFEFTSSLSSSAADFQDLVVLFSFGSAKC